MSDDTEFKAMWEKLDERNARIAQLQVQLMQRENEIRRAREEHMLIQELATVTSLQVRKQQQGDSGIQGSRLPISSQQLDRIVALENEIKLETKRGSELQKESSLLASQIGDAEDAKLRKQQALEQVVEVTGWDQREKVGFVDVEARVLELQHQLSEAEKDQASTRLAASQATARIEQLTKDLEAQRSLEETLVEAKNLLEDKRKELELKREDLESLRRISQRKEAQIAKIEAKDVYKDIRNLEAEKRVLQVQLSKEVDGRRVAEKSIHAQDLQLRQLEQRLSVITHFLRDMLGDKNEDSAQYRPGCAPGQQELSVETFEAVQRQLVVARNTLKERDEQLNGYDAMVESLERKVAILANARMSRTSVAVQEHHALDKDRAEFEQQVQEFEQDFVRERDRLLDERDRLLKLLERVNRPE